MNPADDEINILLPLAFGLVVLFFALLFGLLFWILKKNKVIKITNKSHLFDVLRAAILSIVGVFVIWGIIGFATFVIQVIKNFFVK